MWIDERTITEPLDTVSALELLSLARFGRLGMSRRALPAVVPVRHVVTSGGVLVRAHRAWDHHRACDGAVVAFEADRLDEDAPESWCVQIVGTARNVQATPEERALFGPEPGPVDGQPYDPVYLRIVPQIVTGWRVIPVPRTP